MGHDWIFDVLKDLRSYAEKNGLPALAEKATEALRVAEAEIRRQMTGKDDDGAGGGRLH